VTDVTDDVTDEFQPETLWYQWFFGTFLDM